MDFTSLLSQEINNKKKKRKSNKKSAEKCKKQKIVAEAENDTELTENATNRNRLESENLTIHNHDNAVPVDLEDDNTLDQENVASKPDPRLSLVEGLSDEAIDEKLAQYNENDASLTRLQKLKKLQYLLQIESQDKKYASWLEQEKPYHEDSEKQRVTLESIIDIASHKGELRIQIRVYLKNLISEWEKEDSNSGDHDSLLLETKKDIVKLLYKLRANKLSEEMLISLATIVYHIQASQFNKANESYMKLSIGNICWPIGVANVGIHARSANTRITGGKGVSNIMINESTRKWILSVKRLIGFKERMGQ